MEEPFVAHTKGRLRRPAWAGPALLEGPPQPQSHLAGTGQRAGSPPGPELRTHTPGGRPPGGWHVPAGRTSGLGPSSAWAYV